MSPFASEVAAARAAQHLWVSVPLRQRLRLVRRLRSLLVERAEDLSASVRAEIGRPPVEVLASELLPTAAALRYLEQDARRVLAPRTVGWRYRPVWLMGSRDTVHRRPWGIVGIIGTWNYPIFLNMVQAAQALVAGNAVLWKPSELAPRTGELTHALVLEAGFPRDLFQRLPATREAGPALADAEIDHVVFTGSDGVGRKLAARLGERLVPSTLELSGCDAMFVLADADIEQAARAAWFGLTLNRGQTCIAVRRILVHRSRYEAFTKALGQLAAGARPMPLMTEGQYRQAMWVIDDAVNRGAALLRSPAAPDPGSRSLVPTIILDAPLDAAIGREASFAPVAAVTPFDSIDRAMSLVKQCQFGLAASIFTANARSGRELAAELPAGCVTINDALAPTAHPATPFGGRGASGWGVTQGAEGLLAMTVPQVVSVRKGAFRPHFDEAVMPDPATQDLLMGLLRWTHVSGLGSRFRGLWQLIRGARRRR